ncbi:MAG: DUF6265 family protein [Candidatus Thorarchaeota archaeon]|jgi:hypothetical protein
MTFSTTPLKGKSVKDLEFMTGAWRSATDDSIVEEHWMPEENNNKTGMFRWFREGEIYIYELMALVEKNGTISLYLRHFDKDFAGWEEKDKPREFILTYSSEKGAVFMAPETPDSGFLKYELVDSETLRFADLEPNGDVSFELFFQKIH